MTVSAEERLLGRFRAEFDGRGLANVKFFVRAARVNSAELVDEINLFEDAVAAGDCKIVESVDADFAKTKFDAKFE